MRKLAAVLTLCTLVLGVAACGGDDDDGAEAKSSDETTASDATMPDDVCAAWTAWGKTGSDADLAAFRKAVEAAKDVDTSEILDAVTAMETQETDTADGQAAYEGAFDSINAAVEAGGCPPSRWTNKVMSG